MTRPRAPVRTAYVGALRAQYAALLAVWLGPAAASFASAGELPGRVIRVAPGGGRGAAGTGSAPLASVQEALDRAGPGDIVRLNPGVYRERVAFKTGGTHGRPVVLEGEPGAVIDGAEIAEFDWRPEPSIAGAWRSGGVPFQAFNVVADSKLVTCLKYDRVTPPKVRDEEYLWQNLFRNGIGWTKLKGIRGLALWFPERQELLVRFLGDLDPRRMDISASPGEPCVNISGLDRCVVRGLTLRNAGYGVFIEQSLGSVVERCTITATNHGVWLGEGSDRCTVRFNDITQNPLGEVRHGSEAWANWCAHKRAGFWDSFGVAIRRSKGGHRVHDNFIHDHWGGISDFLGYKGDVNFGGPEVNRGLRIHHNYVLNINDDGLEPNGAEVDCRWHHNTVECCLCGFRIKHPRFGPMYAYRNIFFDNREDFRNYGEVDLMPAEVYVYHNTCTASAAVTSNKVHGIGTPNYHYFNNLFFCEYWWGNSGDSVEPNWKGDFNVYVRRGEDKRWDETKARARKLELDRNSVWVERGDPGFVDFQKRDVRLKSDSPARRKGGVLTHLLGRRLPGTGLPGFYAWRFRFSDPGRRWTPDAGALQFGEPMPKLPRRPQDVKCPAAGSWPEPGER